MIRRSPSVCRGTLILASVSLLPLLLPISGCTSGDHARGATHSKCEEAPWVAPMNSQQFEEHLAFEVVERPAAQAEALPLAAVPLILGAIKIAIPLIQKVIRNEGAKFEATSSISTFAPMSVERSLTNSLARPTLLTTSDFFVLRVVDIPADKFKSLPQAERNAWEKLKFSSDSSKTVLNSLLSEDASSQMREAMDKATQRLSGNTRYLAFAGVGTVTPAKGKEEFHIKLSKYVFAARKAKAVGGVLSKLDKRDDRFVVSITPPQGLSATAGGAFGASVAFPISLAKSSLEVSTIDQSSPPIAVPPFKTWNFSASLVETSDFKAVLNKLADEVGKLNPEDLVQKLQ